MDVEHITGDTSYADLARLHDENCEPFDSLSQCDLFLRVASRLRRMTPDETEHSGNRIKTRDLMDSIQEARRYRNIYSLKINQRPTVIVPKDNLQ